MALVLWYYTGLDLRIDGKEPLRVKSHVCWRTLMDVQEGGRGKTIGRRGLVNKAVDEIMRLPSSPVLLFAVKEIAERTGFSDSE